MIQQIKRLVVSNALLKAAKELDHEAHASLGFCCNVLGRESEAFRLFKEVYWLDSMRPMTSGWFTSYDSAGGDDHLAYNDRQFALLFLRQAVLDGTIPLDYVWKSVKE